MSELHLSRHTLLCIRLLLQASVELNREHAWKHSVVMDEFLWIALSTHAPCLRRRYRRRIVAFSTATRQRTSIRHCSHRDWSQRGDFDTKLKTIHLLAVTVQRVMTTYAATTIVNFVAWDDA